MTLVTLVRESWGLDPLCLSALEKRDGWFYVASRGRSYLLKVYVDSQSRLQEVQKGLAVHRYVQRCGLETSTLVETMEGTLWAPVRNGIAVLESRLGPTHGAPGDADWLAFGELVGRLHSLPVPPEVQPSRLEAERLWDSALARISELRPALARERQCEVKAFLERARATGTSADQPRVLIHSDLCWHNLLRTGDGRLALVDFEGAGTGPVAMDLVEVTTQLCMGPSGSGPLHERSAKLFYRGYRRHRHLTPEELAALADAHILHQLYFLADALERGDLAFVDRMSRRLSTWEEGILARIAQIAGSE